MKNFFKTILFCFVLLVAISCKKEEEQKDVENVQAEIVEKDESLHVIFDVIVPEDDNFQIYWFDNGAPIDPEHYVNIDIKGAPTAQTLDFKIPDDFIPTQLRFDIGSNKNQKEVKFLSCEFKYLDKVFKIQGSDFWMYFGNNASIEYNKEEATAKPITNLPEGYDPIFGGTENTVRELENLYK
ncbi:hypothetical protein GOQ30_15675 [Flavobacterium sp. TP390]|uniref:Lipoprotein n=1 Tax=Flavobacterium profundi TaxID=1774945 RepID=A0A6I4IUQ6_9FLAO|nr:hypothetical protein [Flavobacterium profundi]MVO10613.1 hypothetical protein [Flavobacterium profundi]